MLFHVEFAFNQKPTKATSLSPFQVVYGCNPRTPLDLVPITNPTKFSWETEKIAKEIQDLHAKIRETIEVPIIKLSTMPTTIGSRSFSAQRLGMDSSKEGKVPEQTQVQVNAKVGWSI